MQIKVRLVPPVPAPVIELQIPVKGFDGIYNDDYEIIKLTMSEAMELEASLREARKLALVRTE